MKIEKNIFNKTFFCKLDERNSIKLINLNSLENKYCFNLNCSVITKKKFNKEFIIYLIKINQKLKILLILILKFNQYIYSNETS